MKRIAVQNDLWEIKRALIKKGYEVVDFQQEGHIDAIVYIGDYQGFKNLNNAEGANPYGAIMVNARNKSIDEIEYVIETRRYGNLFS
mgnify:CR=1 FL=1